MNRKRKLNQIIDSKRRNSGRVHVNTRNKSRDEFSFPSSSSYYPDDRKRHWNDDWYENHDDEINERFHDSNSDETCFQDRERRQSFYGSNATNKRNDSYRRENSCIGNRPVYDGDDHRRNNVDYGDREGKYHKRDVEDTSESYMGVEGREEYSYKKRRSPDNEVDFSNNRRYSHKENKFVSHSRRNIFQKTSQLSNRGRMRTIKRRKQISSWVQNGINKIRHAEKQKRNITNRPRLSKERSTPCRKKNMRTNSELNNENDETERDTASQILATLCEAFNGQCNLIRLKNELETSRIGHFASSSNLKVFLEHFPNSFKIENHEFPDQEDGEVVEDASTDEVQVTATPTLFLCIDHSTKAGSCKKECGRLHVCKFYILSSCKFKNHCIFGHDLKSKHNQEVARASLLHKFPTLDPITRRMKYRNYTTMPVICSFYNSRDNRCTKQHCHYLHICTQFIEQRCPGQCGRSHEIKHELLSRYGLLRHSHEDVLDTLRRVQAADVEQLQTIKHIQMRKGNNVTDRAEITDVPGAIFLQNSSLTSGETERFEDESKTSENRHQFHRYPLSFTTEDSEEQESEEHDSSLREKSNSAAKRMDNEKYHEIAIGQHEEPSAPEKKRMLEENAEDSQHSEGFRPTDSDMTNTCQNGVGDGLSVSNPDDISGAPTEWTWSVQIHGREEWEEVKESVSVEEKYREYVTAKDTSIALNSSTSKINFSNMNGKIEKGSAISLKRTKNTMKAETEKNGLASGGIDILKSFGFCRF